MTDLVTDSASAQSPKRKFSFRFPHYLAHHSASIDKDATIGSPTGQHHKSIQSSNKTRNFSEEVKNVPDLQVNDLIFQSNSAQCARFHSKFGVYSFLGLKIRFNFYFILVENCVRS